MTSEDKIKLKTMKWMVLFSTILMIVKFLAYYITSSNAILTDALESIINIVAGLFALYSVYYASHPKDENHPYGHGKIEYLSVGFEGALIFIAGISIITKSIYAFFHPTTINSIDVGTVLIACSGIFNGLMGFYLKKTGTKMQSVLMVADGKHLMSDAISSVGVVLGLVVIYFTKRYWIDNVIAVFFGAFIFHTGYKLVKQSINHLLDEADYEKLENIISLLSKNRREKWIDIHNLRVLKYGQHLHVDCHITLPWYNTLEETHAEITMVENIIKQNERLEIEFFIHADPCLPPQSCSICQVTKCEYRKAPVQKKLDWTLSNVLPDKKHHL